MKILSFVPIILILFSCNSNEKKEEISSQEKILEKMLIELNEEQLKTLEIATAPAKLRSIKTTLLLNGILSVPPQYKVSINAPFGGFVKNLNLMEGSAVVKGQILATIENPEYIQLQQDYLENNSQFGYLYAEYQRQQELSKEQVNSKKALQKSKADLDLLKAKLSGQKAKLGMLGINISKLDAGEIQPSICLYAPINGYVTSVTSNQGSFIGNTDVIMELIDANHLYAELDVFEKDLSKVQKGQEVIFNLSGESKERQGIVHIIGRRIGEDRTANVYCRLLYPDTDLRPGMFLKAKVEVNSSDKIAVPESAIVNFNNKNYLFIKISDTKFEMREVQTGIINEGYSEIISGVIENTQIVVENSFRLLAILKNSGE